MTREDLNVRFDAAAYLQDEETLRAYLRAALDDPTPGALLLALENVNRAIQEGRVKFDAPR